LSRSAIGSRPKGKVGEKVYVPITQYSFGIVCKLASASGTALMTGGEGQMQRLCVFSGKCEQEISEEHNILIILQDAHKLVPNRNRLNVAEKLSATVSALAAKVTDARGIEWGGNKFYKFDPTTKG
jgi:hypothetical protein